MIKAWVYHDGGRKDAGYKGHAGDCVCRAIAIVMDRDYQDVYDDINQFIRSLRQTKRVRTSSARNGMHHPVCEAYMKRCGWRLMRYTKHGLPKCPIIVDFTYHVCAVINRVAYDTHNVFNVKRQHVLGYYIKGR